MKERKKEGRKERKRQNKGIKTEFQARMAFAGCIMRSTLCLRSANLSLCSVGLVRVSTKVGSWVMSYSAVFS